MFSVVDCKFSCSWKNVTVFTMLGRQLLSYKRFVAFVMIVGCISMMIMCMKLRHHHLRKHKKSIVNKADLNDVIDNWSGWLWKHTEPTTIAPTDSAVLSDQAEHFDIEYNPPLRRGLTCNDLMDSASIETLTVRMNVAVVNKNVTISDAMFHTLTTTDDCRYFAYSRGYTSKPVTQEELDFPLAFGILIHKDVYQFEQLLRTIYRPQNSYCIHVDKLAPDDVHIAVQSIVKCFKNVYIASQLVHVAWGTSSRITAEMACQLDALKRNKKWKYFINLTGQDFPLKTNIEIVRILREFNGQNDIMNTREVHLNRLFYVHKDIADVVVNTYTLRTDPLPKNINVRRGDLPCALSRQFVQYLHHSDAGKDWLKWLDKSSFPEESFYHSLASTSSVPGGPGPRDVSQIISRVNSWSIDNQTCNGERVNRVCIYTWEQLPWLTRQPHLFANRFDASRDGLVLRCLEEALNRRTYSPVAFNTGVYKIFAETRLLNSTEQSWQILA
ncbi:core 2-GlcNac-transferase isoform X1 [Saccoglossus kowalevskii]